MFTHRVLRYLRASGPGRRITLVFLLVALLLALPLIVLLKPLTTHAKTLLLLSQELPAVP